MYYPVYTSSYDVVNYLREDVTHIGGYHTSSYFALGTGSRGTAGWDYRVPFEALLNPEMINGLSMVDMEVNHQTRLSSSVWATTPSLESKMSAPVSDNLYKRAMSNFLAETSEFFLHKGLTSFKSNVSDTGFLFKSGSYGMRIKIERSMNKSRVHNTSFPVAQDAYTDIGLYETMTMYSRPSAFGPPVAGSDKFQNLSSPLAQGGRKRQQNSDSLYGKNPSFTPPYYDGECWMDLVYSTTSSVTLTLDELFEKIGVQNKRIQQNAANWPNNGAFRTAEFPMHKDYANNFAMKLDSCINPLSKDFTTSRTSESTKSGRWIIQTKFETPVLNFSDKTLRPLRLDNISLPTNISGGSGWHPIFPKSQIASLNGYGGQTATPLGMWHQFGLIPRGDEGIRISIGDIDIALLKKDSLNAFYVGGPKMKSLCDVVGFKKGQSKKIGKLAESKTVFEAVVAIPYIIKKGERKFFEIPRSMIEYAEDTISNAEAFSKDSTPANQSIIDMVTKMKKYILPPMFDFVTNADITPFAMYIFEFSHTFDQDDLSYIWQNITPKSGKTFAEAEAKISHKIINQELLEDFKDRVRWLVFKIKQRGNNNYYSILSAATTDSAPQAPYSYNWPYDYFSLVEFAQINSQIEYSTDKAIDINESFADVSTSMQKGLRATKELTPSVESNREATARLSQTEQTNRKKEIKSDNRKRRKNQGAFKTKKGDES